METYTFHDRINYFLNTPFNHAHHLEKLPLCDCNRLFMESNLDRPLLQYFFVLVPRKQTSSWIMIEDIDLNELCRLFFSCESNYYVHYSCTKLNWFQFRLHLFKALQNNSLYLFLATLKLLEVTSLVILRDCSDLVVVKKTSKLFHPFAIHPFSSPHIQQTQIGSAEIFLI